MIARRCPEVKPHRRTPRKPSPFGAGLLRSLPTYRAPYTAADAAWRELAHGLAPGDAEFDRLAGEAGAMDRHERGLCC